MNLLVSTISEAHENRRYYSPTSGQSRDNQKDIWNCTKKKFPQYNLFECIMNTVVEKEPELYQFFKSLRNEYYSFKEAYEQKNKEKKEKLTKEIKYDTSKLDQFLAQLAQKGMKLTYKIGYDNDKITFNYNNINFEFRDDDANSFIPMLENKLSSLKKNRLELKDSITRLQGQINLNNQELKHSILKRKEKKQTKEFLEDRAQRYQDSCGLYDKQIEGLEALLEVINDNKDLVAQGVQEVIKEKTLRYELKKADMELAKFHSDFEAYSASEYKAKALEKMIKKGKTTQKGLEKIFFMFS